MFAREPRTLTLADLLAIVAGVSLALATMPESVRHCLDPGAWERELPDPHAYLLITFLLGSWLCVLLGTAAMPAIAYRLWRYGRLPRPGEWLVILLVVISPLVGMARLIYAPLEWCHGLPDPMYAWDLGTALGGDSWLVQPAATEIACGTLVCLAGVLLLRRLRNMPPLVTSLWLVGCLVIYLALPARAGTWTFGRQYLVPFWNSVSWQEFESHPVDVMTHVPTWLPVAVAVGFLLLSLRKRSPLRWNWTEWLGAVMLLSTLGLYSVLLWYPSVDYSEWPWWLGAAILGVALSRPLRWFWEFWIGDRPATREYRSCDPDLRTE